jgi:hypothetical protein
MPLFIPQPQRLLVPPILFPELQPDIAIARTTIKKITVTFSFSIEIDY